jgi:hypothetical protein
MIRSINAKMNLCKNGLKKRGVLEEKANNCSVEPGY